MNEEWKAVVGYEGLYEVSNFGRVKSLSWRGTGKERMISLKDHKEGYKHVILYKRGHQKAYLVHRLVAEAFLDNPNNLPQINHKDLNKQNNVLSNLEWCTAEENAQHFKLNIKESQRLRSSWHSNTEIAQYSSDGNLVRKWRNCLEVKDVLHYNQTSIWECCDGKRKTAYGFIWRYVS